jgi:tetratricopeptide (TPR) repeat protein
LGRYEEAKEMLDAHKFHPWEGGEGKVSAQYQIARVELAKQALKSGNNQEAITLLNECQEYPHHLGEGKLSGAQENDFHYYLGCAYEALGNQEKAVFYWELAKNGITEPAAAIFYNDQKPDKIFYQGLALLKLNRVAEANSRFNRLISYGEEHLSDEIKMDYFAVSLPDLLIWEDDLTLRNMIHCKYMMALGLFGLGNKETASELLDEVSKMDPNHQGIMAIKSSI